MRIAYLHDMLRKLAFKLATRNSSGAESFALDGNENGLVADLTFSEERLPFFRIREVNAMGVSGSWVNEHENRSEASIPFSLMVGETFRVRHFLKGLRIRYDGYQDFVWGTITAYATRQRIKEYAVQRVFNASTRFRRDRIALLKEMVKQDITYKGEDEIWSKRKKFEKHVTIGELYGYRVYSHPEFKSEDRRFDLLIESLVHTGDLEEKDSGYYVSGKAIETISKHESEERRHYDTVRQSWIMIVLTLVIAASTLISAWR